MSDDQLSLSSSQPRRGSTGGIAKHHGPSLDELVALEDAETKAKHIHPAVAAALAIAAGIAAIVQTGLNANLRDAMVPSALVTSGSSFAIGTVTMLLVSIMHQPPSLRCGPSLSNKTASSCKDIPWFAYTGGILGAAYVLSTILLAPKLGFTTFQLASVSGQLLSGIACDAVGLLHLKPSHPTKWRWICVTLCLAGTGLSARWSDGSIPARKTAVYGLLAALAGSVFPIQACVNYMLGTYVGTPLPFNSPLAWSLPGLPW